MTEAARRAGLRFILNVVLDDDKHILRVTAGDPELAFQDLVNFAKSVYEVPIPQQYDIAIGGVGFPKDANLYQASRAPSYLFFAPTPVVRPGGFFIIPARCEEGAGAGVGEQRFLAAMRDAPNIQFILDDARRNGYPPGQQRAFVMAKVLEKSNVVIVGSECPDLVAACKMIPAATMEEAIELASARLGPSCEVLIVPHAMLTLPVSSRQKPSDNNNMQMKALQVVKPRYFAQVQSSSPRPENCWRRPDPGPAELGFDVRQRYPLFHRQQTTQILSTACRRSHP